MPDLLFELVSSRHAEKPCCAVCACTCVQSANPCPGPPPAPSAVPDAPPRLLSILFPHPAWNRKRLAIKILAGGKLFIMHMNILESKEL